MDNNTAHRETETFIRRVIVSSLLLVLTVSLLAGLIYIRLDPIKSALVELQIRNGSYAEALELAETISDSSLRLQSKYRIASGKLDDGLYDEAAQLFRTLGDYRASRTLSLQCAYIIADNLLAQGQLDDAIEAFTLLGDYSNSHERQLQIKYMQADHAHSSGAYSQAVLLFLALGDYSDCADRAYQSAVALTGDEAIAREMISSDGLTPEELKKTLHIAERRAIFPYDAIDAGAYHTVLLHADGTVSACGDNTYGQCDVSSWRDIVQIAAGAYHTVGLRKDGTVVAAGKNSAQQCNVSHWQDIVSIAAGDSDTYALTREGKVLSCGYHDYADIRQAANIEDIYAGSYAAIAATAFGSYIPSHKTYSLRAQKEVVAVKLHTGYVLALQADGTCISSLDCVSSWSEIVHIDAGPTAVVAVDGDGNAQAHFFRNTDAVDLSAVQNACQCAVGTEHFVFLLEDGTLLAFGDNSLGQCNVASLG